MVFYIDIVGSCNLRCKGCPSAHFGKRTGEKMSLELFSRILDKLIGQYDDADYLGFYNWTEPLLHPRLDEFVARTKQAKPGIRTSVSSNLSLRNIDCLLRAVDCGLDQLIVSVSGISQEVYSRYHVQGDIELVKANIQKVSDYISARKAATHLDVHFLQFNDNQAEELLMQRFCTPALVNFYPKEACYAKGVDNSENLARLKYQFSPNNSDSALNLLAPRRCGDLQLGQPCEQVFDVVALNHKGEVFLCCSRYNLPEYKIGSFIDLAPEEMLYYKVTHPECFYCRGQRRPATAADFNRLQKALYFGASRDSLRVNRLLTNGLYHAPEYKSPLSTQT